MRAGFGKSDITPAIGTELAGFGYYLNRRALEIIDPLHARAVILEDGDTRALIVSCDLLGLSKKVCAEITAHAEKFGIPAENTLIVSVHTHCGPAIKYHEGCGYTDEKYLATVAQRICGAIDAANDDVSDVTGISQAFSLCDGDYIYNRADANGPVDRNVRGFVIERSGMPAIAMVSAACHGVFRGRLPAASADFSGEICRLIDETGMHGIYINGLCGDIDPYMPSGERLCEYAKLAKDAFFSSMNELPLTLECGSAQFALRLTPVTAADISGAAREAVNRAGGEDVPQARVALIWEKEMLEKLDNLSNTEDITIKYMLLGGVPVMALPFEGFTRIGMDIRAVCGREDAIILGCAEELLGYLPTKDDINRGSYAALESTFLYKRLPVVPGEAERLGEEMGVALKSALK